MIYKDNIVIVKLTDCISKNNFIPITNWRYDLWGYKTLFGFLNKNNIYHILPNLDSNNATWDYHNTLTVSSHLQYSSNDILFLFDTVVLIDNPLEPWVEAIKIFDKLCKDGEYIYT